MSASETRILPLFPTPAAAPPRASLAMVSMPKTAWYWLDDLVSRQYRGEYRALVQDFCEAATCNPDSLATALRQCAEVYCHNQMERLYNLANDNVTLGGIDISRLKVSASHPETPDMSARMPTAYQLFRFLPHATYLTTVWERRNYHLHY